MSFNNTNNSLQQQDNPTEKTIKNKGFVLLDKIFKDNGWDLVENKINKICYVKRGFEMDMFDITIDKNQIHVSIPIKNSEIQYVKSFTNYFIACEYIEARFNDFIKIELPLTSLSSEVSNVP
jgi:hypothetical protein